MKRPTQLVCALGLTQIAGYGSIYYSFSILAADVARDFGRTSSWFFLVFSGALIAGGLVMPFAGKLFDRFGAAQLMAAGSMLTGLFLVFTSTTHSLWAFAIGMALIQIVSGFVLYDAAFTTIVQSGLGGSQNMIMYLTLIAGFASTLFWPLTTALDHQWGWRWTMVFFAALNLAFCFPTHVWLSRNFRKAAHPAQASTASVAATTEQPMDRRTSLRLMIMVTAGFAISGVTLSAILSQMVPMLHELGLGNMALLVSTLFGPAQVAMRAVQIFFGKSQHPLTITIFALSLLPLALFILAITAPWIAGAVAFAILVGLASGLKSIVQGTLPLVVFGRTGYGSRIGIMSGFRYVTAALAPFAFSLLGEVTTTRTTAMIFAAIGVVGLLCFIDVIYVLRRRGQGVPL
ncbi:MFS transporter [Aestuariivirga litoralis]|uniref:MFS transporter n=1 Tax=Aestuariivirga litoralis TaxID=2650924 RepID=UPI0018C80C38